MNGQRLLRRRRPRYDLRPACIRFRAAYAGHIAAIGRKFGCVLGAALVVLGGALWPGWRFAHMTAAEHLRAATSALDEQSLKTAQRHLNAVSADTPGTARLTRKLAAGLQTHQAALQQEASAALALQAQAESQRLAVRELEQNLRNLGFDVTVAQSVNPSEITIASRAFDDPGQRDRFMTFLHGPNSPIAATCAAGIQAVRLKGPGLFFGFSDRFSLDCYMR